MKTALITGITGQDGSYLSELLLQKGYMVHGLVRRQSAIGRMGVDYSCESGGICDRQPKLHLAELSDTTRIRRLLQEIQPDEFYHLAGQSSVGASFEIPETTCELNAMTTLRILEILRDIDQPPRFLHMSSSEVFGTSNASPQSEDTPFRPVSPYGVAKAFATEMVRVYRESHGLFAANAICYNHESPRRGETFVTRKITRAATRIREGLQGKLHLGNLLARRDWGYAKDYVEAMWLMLQQNESNDFVIATGETHSVQEFMELTFEEVGLPWKQHVEIDARYLRPSEVDLLLGDATRAREELGWAPDVSFKELVRLMVHSDWEMAMAERDIKRRAIA
jgi:GDPmannose 4,6-dehydratase